MKTSPASSITLPAADIAAPAENRGVLLAQVAALTRLSFRRLVGSKIFWGVLFLSTMPVLLMGFVAVMMIIHNNGNMRAPEQMLAILGKLFTGGYIHFGLFFAAFVFGVHATRDDVDDQTLHYYFLQPVPRWMLPISKFVAYLAFATPCFILSLVAIQALFVAPYGWDAAKHVILTGDYAAQLGAEMLVVFLMLAVYGAFFLAVSCLVKNPVVAIVVYSWELGIRFLPETVKNWSLVHHMKAILPSVVDNNNAAIGVLAEGPGPIQVFLVLTFVFAFSMGFACWWSTRRECLYTV